MNNKQSFENIFDLDLVLLLISDRDGRIAKVNKAWETTLGYAEEELLGRCFLEFIHPDDKAPTLEQIKLLNQHQGCLDLLTGIEQKTGPINIWNGMQSQTTNPSIP